MARPRRLWAVAPAKVNLGLEIVGRRADGYHDLVTLFQAISLFDSFEWIDTGAPFVYEGPPGVPVEVDLVTRVFNAAPDRASWTGQLRLHKRIPMAAGLGGGSTDAALALRLAFPDTTDDDLHERAAVLGADVPFFLDGGAALATGTGTTLERREPRSGWVVLVTPEVEIERKTATLYGGLSAEDFSDGRRVLGVAEFPNAFLRQLLTYGRVRYAYDALRRAEGQTAAVSISGAGPTLYALADTWIAARAIADRLPGDVGAIRIVRTIGASDHRPIERMARAMRGSIDDAS
jgi:4-diphosphocytidyl-2-C-methyl-D-erythritol kinase